MSKTGLEQMVSGRDPFSLGTELRLERQEMLRIALSEAVRKYREITRGRDVRWVDGYGQACTGVICAALAYVEDDE